MTLSLAESHAVNHMVSHLIGAADATGAPLIDRSTAIVCLTFLASRCAQTVPTGRGPDRTYADLTALWPGGLREVWLAELHGGEPVPFASELLARHYVLTEGRWDPGTDLSWRTGRPDDHGRTAKILYANGTHTLCSIWPAPIRFALADRTELTEGRVDQVRSCQVCGCTDDEACESGCTWLWLTGDETGLQVDLCSQCAWTITRDALQSGLYRPGLRMTPQQAADFDAKIESGEIDLSGESGAIWPLPDDDAATLDEQAEGAEMNANYLHACQTIAAMHKAAVGETRGPIRGVVEDVADIRIRMLAAEGLAQLFFDGLERVAARIGGTCDFDAMESAAPADEGFARDMDALNTFAGQVYAEAERAYSAAVKAGGLPALDDRIPGEPEPHLVTVSRLPDAFDPDDTKPFETITGNDAAGWTSFVVEHTARCSGLPYGKQCWYDDEWNNGQYSYDDIQPGRYRVSLERQDVGDHLGEYSHTEDFLHFEPLTTPTEPTAGSEAADPC